jgi:hypothetical protein
LFNTSPTQVTNTATLTANATKGSSVSRYKLSTIDIQGNNILTLAGASDGSTTYIQIYVTGDIRTSGNAQISVQPGVKAEIYFEGNVDVAGNGIINMANEPSNLQLFGIQPSPGSADRHVNLGGNGQISASVYAPNHDVTINGGGTTGHVFGSVVGKTTIMTGVTNLHYDEALSSIGLINNYKIVSWFEDNR